MEGHGRTHDPSVGLGSFGFLVLSRRRMPGAEELSTVLTPSVCHLDLGQPSGQEVSGDEPEGGVVTVTIEAGREKLASY